MSFYSKYELLALLRDEAIKTFSAVDKATGREVLVHLFPSAPLPEQGALLRQVASLPPESRREILAEGQHEGTPYVVTTTAIGPGGFRHWIQERSAAGTALPSGDGDPPTEFNRLFQRRPEAAAPKSVEEKALPAGAPESPEPETFQRLFGAKTPGAPGGSPVKTPAQVRAELTRMWQTPARPQTRGAQEQPAPDESGPEPLARPVAAESALPQPPPAASTRVYGTPAAEPAPVSPLSVAPEPATPEPVQQPGEFTRMFRAVEPESRAEPAPEPAAPPPAGEFTRMFRAQQAEPAPPVEAPGKPEPGEFTRMFEAPSYRPQSPPMETPPAQPPVRNAAGAGEFTRMFQSPLQPEPLKSSSPFSNQPAMPPPPAPRRVGEFTQMFGRPDTPLPPVVPTGGAPGGTAAPHTQALGGGATQAFSLPVAPAPAASPAQDFGSAPQPHAAGEFTRMFNAPSAGPTLGTAPPAPPEPPRQTARSSPLPLILGLAGLLVLAIIVILFVALRKH